MKRTNALAVILALAFATVAVPKAEAEFIGVAQHDPWVVELTAGALNGGPTAVVVTWITKGGLLKVVDSFTVPPGEIRQGVAHNAIPKNVTRIMVDIDPAVGGNGFFKFTQGVAAEFNPLFQGDARFVIDIAP